MYHIIPLCCICSKTNKSLKILSENDLEVLDMLSTQLYDFENLKNELPIYMCDACLLDLEKVKVFQKLFNDSVTQMLGYIEQLKYDEYFCIPIIKIDTQQDIENIQNEYIIRNQPKIYLQKLSDEEINKYSFQNQASYDETSIVPNEDDEIIEITCDVEISECFDPFVIEKTNGQLKQWINESETSENVKNIWDKLLETKDSQYNDPLADIIEKRIGQNETKTNEKQAIVLPKGKKKRVRAIFGKKKNKKGRTNLGETSAKIRGKNKKQSNVLDETMAKNYLELCEVKTNKRGQIKIVRSTTQSIVLGETQTEQSSNVLDETVAQNNLEICNDVTAEQLNNKTIQVSNVCTTQPAIVCSIQSNVLDGTSAKNNQATKTNEGGNKRLRSANVLTKDNPPPPNILINNIRHKFASIVDKTTSEDAVNLDIVKNEPIFDSDSIVVDETKIKEELFQ